jgi:hypothetical protein
MSNPDFLHDVEAEVQAELTIAESSHAGIDTPVTEWQYDPTDAERYEVGLRGLLGAVKAMEDRPAAAEEGDA